MAPSAVEHEVPVLPSVTKKGAPIRKPLELSGALDGFESFDVTPTIGKEFVNVDVAEWLKAPNSDELLRELAITISQRGVVFFRAQDNLTNDLQKELVHRMGQLTGKPATSTLHIHPVLNDDRELGGTDKEISTISSKQNSKFYENRAYSVSNKNQSSAAWHSDIAFEPVPADYTALRLTELPKTGGDTLWASGYELYDRLSAPYQRFLESLTATFQQPGFNRIAEREGFELHAGPRGAPENVGTELKAVHPVIRTNPVTGWKSVFPVGHHIAHINDVTKEESASLLQWFLDLVYRNHDVQVRLRWQNANDLAIWDNRSVFHTATYDFSEEIHGERFGNRAVGLGEKPYLDPNSSSRREVLGRLGLV
ncbi:uncharacterized protein K452DRAFT_279655 [Aplosporella prunicola CBS 121167]|uniref:TauD/TfdA-like domain-containing protein n=1 Tax=Aplosporella prunicola CBS 121167 TaxID=1176127 RepID=A0A6A6AZK4_9PEZI|nr:uncharacterized protein K452DRAFT_279655 [Aplosporella prunicola CBS 121167]KAF2136698.1 hypothetical protein K452DRAFT_279655 [Aplosporella prunicola CBS 121167]